MSISKRILYMGILSLVIVCCAKKKSADSLIEDLESGYDDVRRQAMMDLLRRNKDEVVPPLIEVLRTETDQAKYMTVQILGKMNDQRAVEPLIALLEAHNEHLRAAVAEALGNFKRPEGHRCASAMYEKSL